MSFSNQASAIKQGPNNNTMVGSQEQTSQILKKILKALAVGKSMQIEFLTKTTAPVEVKVSDNSSTKINLQNATRLSKEEENSSNKVLSSLFGFP